MEKAEKENLISQIARLSYEEKMEIIQRVNKSMETRETLVHHLTDLKGVGREIWEEVDVEKYLDEER